MRQIPTERKYARFVVKKLIKQGAVTRPTTCDDCGDTFPELHIQAFCPDFSRLYDFIWVCGRCMNKRVGS